MPDWAKELLGYGPLGALAVAVGWVIYMLVTRGGPKALALGERYVASTENLHDSLKESMNNQQGLCQLHGDAIATHDKQMRRAALQACSMCREIVAKEMPNSSATVAKHCDEIERIIGEA